MIIISVIALFLFLYLLYSLCFISGRESDQEEQRNLNEWRAGLSRNDLVMYAGSKYVLKSSDGRVCEIMNHNDQLFVLLTDLWPAE